MKPGEIVGPVQTEFGFHVIRLVDIAPARARPFDEVKAQIEADLKRQKTTQKFAAAADQFQNLVYEQADSLAPVAKTLDLKVETTPFDTRAQIQALAMGNAKFVDAVFSQESRESKRNTEAIEVAPSVLMAGRIVEYKPATPRPFAEVEGEIRAQLLQRAASELAQKAGAEKLAALDAGKTDAQAGVTFGKPLMVNRNQSQPDLSPDALNKVFQMSAAKLPGYAGAPNERGGFSIYKLTKVVDPPAPDAGKLSGAGNRIGSELGRELLTAYIGSLKQGTEVKINQAAIEKKQ